MATTFKTPGVYIQEIDSFPPSINAVETAIPAFIGYTQMAADQNGPLVKIPRKISSLLEYQQFFGFGPKPTVEKVTLDNNNNFVSADVQIDWKMYQSVSMFYANGGGDCYIVSAGLYPASTSDANYADFLTDISPAELSPLSAIAKVDEPTLLVFPDNKLLGEHYKDVYTAALEQCATLQDRFLVCDVDYDPTSSDDPGSQFRDDIGVNNLSYAAAYIPWLNIASPSVIGYADYKDVIHVGTALVSSVANLTTDTAAYNAVQDLDNLLVDIDNIGSSTDSLIVSPASTLSGYYSSLKAAVQTATSPGTALGDLFSFAYNIANTVNNFIVGSSPLHSSLASNPATSLLTTVQNFIDGTNTTTGFSSLYTPLAQYNNLADDTTTETQAQVILTVTKGQAYANAVAVLTVGTPAHLDTITAITVNEGSGNIVNLLGTTYTWGSGSLLTELGNLVTAINAQQSSFTASVDTVNSRIKITDATHSGAAGSLFILSSTAGLSNTSLTVSVTQQFQGGADADKINSLTVKNGATTLLSLSTPFVQLATDTTDAMTTTSLLAVLTTGVVNSGVVVSSGPTSNQITIKAAPGSDEAGNADLLTYTKTAVTLSVGLGSGTYFTGGVYTNTAISGYTTPGVASSLASSWAGSSNPFTISVLPLSPYPSSVTTDAQKAAYIAQQIDSYMTQIIQLYSTILPAAQAKEANTEAALTNSFPVLSAIASGVNNAPISMPPSGAIVGLYAAVDNDRGVWKAPANVSVNNVLGPDSTFNNGQLDELNVDVNAGKSINAIRPFKGKGTLVYGARTLAGNDNNWRYVNVRRFFIMVEQSVKKAIESFVFEPNDANTWNRTKAMVDAFLFQQWRAGALQGSKPDQAYFVKVGLGETMVAQDILEGRMIVSIGMAVVHPAEFIVLQFSQIMPQS